MPTFGNQPRPQDRRRRGLQARRMTLDPTFSASLGTFSARASRKNFGAGAGVAGVGAAGVAGYGSEGIGAQMAAVERFMRSTVEWGRRIAQKVETAFTIDETGLFILNETEALSSGEATIATNLPISDTGFWWAGIQVRVSGASAACMATAEAGYGISFPVDELTHGPGVGTYAGAGYMRPFGASGDAFSMTVRTHPAVTGTVSAIIVLETLIAGDIQT